MFKLQTRACVHTVSKLALPDSSNNNNDNKSPGDNSSDKVKAKRMFHDDTLKSFFRRLTFSPDGQLLVVPAGCLETSEKAVNTTYVFTKASLGK